jgi:hypothetical protein
MSERRSRYHGDGVLYWRRWKGQSVTMRLKTDEAVVTLYEIRRLASRCPSRESLLLVHLHLKRRLLRFNRRLRASVRGLPFKCKSDTIRNGREFTSSRRNLAM